jgi:NAD(P)-dependent dehydrogenase (short-subunit alcohol dehydrogenase family)
VAELAGRTALVAGGSRGIGRAVAVALAERGADVAVAARTAPDLEALGAEVEGLGRRFLAIIGDLGTVEGPDAIAREALAWADVDILVNVAGTVVRKDILATDAGDWDSTFAVNVRGPFLLARALGPHMLERGGSIVNVTSVAGSSTTTRGSISYATSKAALSHMTRILAARWAPKVRVNAVAPGYMRTDFTAAWLEDPENERFVVEATPLGRVGEVADVAAAVAFLASPAASHITGHELPVDGGWDL